VELQAFLITFREALEALLIVGIITSYLKRVDRPEFNKYVWIGALLAVVASLGLAIVFQVVLDGFASMGAETYMKVSIMFISAALLTQMVFWMSEQSKGIKDKATSKFDQFITAGNVVGMVVHAFLVVLREGVETVFFFAAITGGDIGKAMQGWGAIGGIAVAGLVAFFFFKGTMKVSLSRFFQVSGFFIILIAAGLLVQGIAILQDMHILGSVLPHLYDLTWFLPEHPIDAEHYLRDTGVAPWFSGQVGIFFKALFGYSSSPSVEEVLVYWMYFASLWLLLRNRQEKKEQAAPQPPKAHTVK
jgi:high-affinity iron transporter